MKIIINPQKFAVYSFFFSLNFESMNLFNLDIDYLASKITITILLIISFFNYKLLFSLKHFSRFLTPILIYFGLVTVISFINISFLSKTFFDFPFFLNILIFLILVNYSRIESGILLKGLFVFALSTFILSLCYFLGIEVTDPLDGRYTVFGMNDNILGLSLCISLFILISIIFENRFEIGNNRYLLLLLFPFLFIFMIKTGSRVAFISFVVGLFLMLYFNKSIAPRKKAVLIVTIIFVFILFWIIFLKNSVIAERLVNSVNEGDLSSRDLIWLKLFDIILNNPILGVGKTGYAAQVEPMMGGSASPHNVIIEVLCYTGVIGLSIFLFYFFRIVSVAFEKKKFCGELLPVVLLVPIFGTILSGQIFDQKFIWILFAFIVSNSAETVKADDFCEKKFDDSIHEIN